jgi:hypothetical protein
MARPSVAYGCVIFAALVGCGGSDDNAGPTAAAADTVVDLSASDLTHQQIGVRSWSLSKVDDLAKPVTISGKGDDGAILVEWSGPLGLALSYSYTGPGQGVACTIQPDGSSFERNATCAESFGRADALLQADLAGSDWNLGGSGTSDGAGTAEAADSKGCDEPRLIALAKDAKLCVFDGLNSAGAVVVGGYIVYSAYVLATTIATVLAVGNATLENPINGNQLVDTEEKAFNAFIRTQRALDIANTRISILRNGIQLV